MVANGTEPSRGPMDHSLLGQGAKEVALRLREKGYEAYFAGGCVRDLLLGLSPKDYDIVTNARPEQIAQVFARTVMVGASFGVVRVRIRRGFEYEVATYRSDGTYSDGRRPDEVSYAQTKEEDVSRRDLTINALLMDPESGEVIDLVNGQEDLKKGLIRAVGDPEERFSEDRLRMLRAIRFAARFGFSVDEATMGAIRNNASHIRQVSVERVVLELRGVWCSPRPAVGWALFHGSGLLPRLFPMEGAPSQAVAEVERGFERICGAQPPLGARDRAVVAWALVFSCFEVPNLEDELRRLKLSRDEIKRTLVLCQERRVLEAGAGAPLSELVRFTERDERDAGRLFLVARLGKDAPAVRHLESVIQDLKTNPLPAEARLSGKDLFGLGYHAGPEFKTMLTAVENEVFERRISTKKDALAFVLERFERPKET